MASTLKAAQWFSIQKPNPRASIRIFCFPYAGGGSQIYRTWPQSLLSDVEVCTAQLPGRGTRMREQPFDNILPMVEALAGAIEPYLDKPFAFFGHSMGAMISFELVRQLRAARGIEPAHLFVSGRRAPQIPNEDPITYNLPEAEFCEELLRLNGTPKEVIDQPELMQIMLPLLRADFSVVETYAYRPDVSLDCPITVFGGLQDTEVTRDQLEAWREQTTASCTLRMLPGNHFFLNDVQAQAILLRVISKELQQLLQSKISRP
jgi:medium-chain acyl-[acyl-carrier-protein] hydrolase